MSNKITRKEAVGIYAKYAKDIEQTIMNSGCVQPVKFLTSRSYVDKGKNVQEFYCQACGSTHNNITHSGHYRGYGNYSYACPTCGNENYTNGRTINSNTSELYVEPQDDGFKFALYRTTHHISSDEPKWWLQEPVATISIQEVGSFDSVNGWYVYSERDVKLLARNSIAEEEAINRVKKTKPVNKFDGNFPTMLAEAAVFEAKKAASNAARKSASKTTLLEEMRSAYKPQEIDESKLLDTSHTVLHEVYSTKDDKTTYMACCTKCGKIFEAEVEEDENALRVITCPDCGTSGDVSSYSRYSYNYGRKAYTQNIAIFENTHLPENDLLIRVFEISRQFDINTGYQQTVLERQRIFCGKKVTVYGRSYNWSTKTYSDFEKHTIRDIDSSLVGYRRDAQVVQSDEEIAEIIRNSCLMYSGLVESYGIGNKLYKGFEPAPSLKYLMTWYKKPAIELIMKSNLTNMTEYMISNPEHIGEGKTLAEALGVKPAVAKIVVKLNLDYRSMTDLSALYNADNTLTAESFTAIRQLDLPTFQLAQLKGTYGIDYDQTMKYLEAVYNHQCIEKREALTQWVDYLRMATALHMDLTDKSRLYPGSLKKEHDVATFAYRAIQIDVDKEKFALQAEENAYFEYTYKDLMVIVPRTPQEIVEEATRQKNCLRSYVERVKNGDTVVVFIRRKIMPDATYVTAEVHNGRLTQLKGYCNSNPRNRELVEFVQHWSKAKGIRVEC
jgi:predicted RNA-binding Zn-ribbon protein involved in translation (DUF1610 family)